MNFTKVVFVWIELESPITSKFQNAYNCRQEKWWFKKIQEKWWFKKIETQLSSLPIISREFAWDECCDWQIIVYSIAQAGRHQQAVSSLLIAIFPVMFILYDGKTLSKKWHDNVLSIEHFNLNNIKWAPKHWWLCAAVWKYIVGHNVVTIFYLFLT